MSNELAVQGSHEVRDLIVFNDEQKDLIRKTLAPKATELEFQLFIAMCQRRGLDPTMNQMYVVSFGEGEYRQVSFIVGIDGYRILADRGGDYMPGPKAEFTFNEDGSLCSAIGHVMVRKDGHWHQVSEEVFYSERVQTVRDRQTGKQVPRANWAKMPKTMLQKCAEAAAIRRAFPMEVGGIYVEEESPGTQYDSEMSSTAPAVPTDEIQRRIEAKRAERALPAESVGAAPEPEKAPVMTRAQLDELGALAQELDALGLPRFRAITDADTAESIVQLIELTRAMVNGAQAAKQTASAASEQKALEEINAKYTALRAEALALGIETKPYPETVSLKKREKGYGLVLELVNEAKAKLEKQGLVEEPDEFDGEPEESPGPAPELVLTPPAAPVPAATSGDKAVMAVVEANFRGRAKAKGLDPDSPAMVDACLKFFIDDGMGATVEGVGSFAEFPGGHQRRLFNALLDEGAPLRW